MKKIFMFAAVVAMSLMLSAPFVQAQAKDNKPAPQAPSSAGDQAKMLEAFKKEAPLTQKDVEIFIKMMPELSKVANDEAKVLGIIKKHGLTEMRGAYVSAKMGVAFMALSQGGEEAVEAMMAQVPEQIRPTKSELELVKKNQDAIQKVFLGAAGKAAPKK